ncbi:hypothetical protein VNO77_13961 [Canavalia gladiata]|uniref:Uncharacterized protein n=1 Tax=Canavalia gladiata TaxID=3824 RepID=A0AAN9M351_CANGL
MEEMEARVTFMSARVERRKGIMEWESVPFCSVSIGVRMPWGRSQGGERRRRRRIHAILPWSPLQPPPLLFSSLLFSSL